jgi:hypothetical protein
MEMTPKKLCRFLGAVEGCHPLADHYQLRSLSRCDKDWCVTRVQGEEFDTVVLPALLGDGLGGVVFFTVKRPPFSGPPMELDWTRTMRRRGVEE